MYGLTVEDLQLMPQRALSKNASGLIYDPHENKYLLHFRDNKTPYYPESWALFGGGSEGIETPTETLIRELAEELLLCASPRALIALGKRAKSFGEYSHYFLVIIDQRMHRLHLQEGADMAWFTPEELMSVTYTDAVTPGLVFLRERNQLIVPERKRQEYLLLT